MMLAVANKQSFAWRSKGRARPGKRPLPNPLCWCITLALLPGTVAGAQRVTSTAPTQATGNASAETPPQATGTALPPPGAEGLPEAPSADRYPTAVPVPEAGERTVLLESLHQSRSGEEVLLEGDVHIQYGSYSLDADRITYNDATGDASATGHIHIQSANGDETIRASHAELNIRNETGSFYDVEGSIGLRSTLRGNIYTNDNPFLFTGRRVVKTGPAAFDIYDGTVTSCQLPRPDWQLVSHHFAIANGKAKASRTTFRLFNLPIVFFPYVTQPTSEGQRQSGFMIPVVGSSSKKGFVLGEEIFMTLGRSADLTVGAQYYSSRGWQQSANFRYRGNGQDFVNARYSGLFDRGYYQAGVDANNNPTQTYVNQGGEDILLSGRKDVSDHTRFAGNAEYLSSYIYREAFTDNFNQAVSSDITSYAYGTHQRDGYVASAEFDRYQGLKVVRTGDQIRIFHAPLLQGEVLERRLGNTPFVWSATSQYTALKRTQGTPLAQTGFASDFVSRVDVHPRLSLPFALGGFHFRPSVGLRDTWYQHSRAATALPGPPPSERAAALNRLLTEAEFELRAPVLERTFDTGVFSRFLGRQAKHTIEPELHYRYASGVGDFSRTLRFDDTDVVSNKNELEYGFVQRLFLRPSKTRDCSPDETPSETDGTCGGARETLRWKLVQRTYFDPTFGGVIVNGRRNVLDTTLDLSGVAFLTDSRAASPIVSEMKLSATDHIDLEWDMNYDTHAGKFTQSNTFLDYHAGNYFGGMSHARLNAPGRFSTGTGTGNDTITSATSDFSQLRLLLGYGNLTKPGLSVATNVGLDLSAVQPQSTTAHVVRAAQVQYGAAQFAYNWNCCGFAVEYRKYQLGSVRNENSYRFNFTLANIGSAGNIRRAERLF